MDELYLLPEARGQGISTQAIQMMIETCRSNGIQAVHLEVRPDNEAMIEHCEKSGFKRRNFSLMSRVISS